MRKLFVGVAALAMACAGGARADVFTNVPSSETAGYQLVYQLAIPTTSPGWNTAGVLTGASGYSVNNSASIPQGSFTRVAYYFELLGAGGSLPNGWVYVSFDTFTPRADRIGVPTSQNAAMFQQNVSNMNVYSNVPGIVTGTGITTGNIEFWPSNYNQTNGRSAGNGGAVVNASATTYDFGDGGAGTSNGHGSMQIHNYDLDGTGVGTAGQTLFGYGAWGAVRTSELGIGNNPNAAQAPDWTVTANAGSWTTKNLQILVLPEPSSAAVILVGGGLLLRRRMRRA